MRSIFWKEWNQLFSSLTAYIAIIVFLATTALLVFVLPETSIFSYGYANLDSFFDVAPFVLLFLVPALTMGLLAEERSEQTLEILLTKPLTVQNLVLGKYFASISVLFLAILPTIFYVYIIGQLAEPVNSLDYGAIWGSYLGLFCLGACFCAIGLFASSLTTNQIVAFILGLFLCFIMYFVFSSLSQLPWFYGRFDYFLQQLGIEYHYTSISRGVITLSDLAYFFTLVVLFLFITLFTVQLNRSKS